MRGLHAYENSAQRRLNPLQLGIIGSTDTHAGTGGFVDEDAWRGSVFGLGSFERSMRRVAFNPGGLVAVWAEQNTRSSIFAALKRREVYATSGPRIRLRMDAAHAPLDCAAAAPPTAVPMGATLAGGADVYLRVQAQADRVPLARIDIVRGYSRGDEIHEQVVTVWSRNDATPRTMDVCVTWQDPGFEAAHPAFWYARVVETPTPRWSAFACARAARCDEFPEADRWIQERAWTSPVWHLP